MEHWAEEKVSKMENEAVNRDFGSIQDKISRLKKPRFYKRHLLNSVNQALEK
jgi:hypothetical protein